MNPFLEEGRTVGNPEWRTYGGDVESETNVHRDEGLGSEDGVSVRREGGQSRRSRGSLGFVETHLLCKPSYFR